MNEEISTLRAAIADLAQLCFARGDREWRDARAVLEKYELLVDVPLPDEIPRSPDVFPEFGREELFALKWSEVAKVAKKGRA